MSAAPESDAAAQWTGELGALLLGQMPMGIAVFDRDLRLQRSNPTWAAFIERYTPSSARDVVPCARLYDLAPGSEVALRPIFDRVLAGETLRQDALRSESDGIVSYWDVVLAPLVHEGKVVGVLDVTTDATERVLTAGRLEQRLAALVGIAESLTLGRPMDETLDALAACVVGASTAVACSVLLFDAETERVRVAGSSGLPPGYLAALEGSWRGGARSLTLRVFRSGEPVFMADARRTLLADPLYAPIHPYLREMTWETGYILPLRADGRGLGAVTLFYEGDEPPDADEATFLRAAADQAALAVEQAHLYAQARRLAGLEERQRLARELHDSVAQTLFGIRLTAQSARALLARDPGRAAASVDYVLSLAEGGIAETRALVFALRPDALEREGLVAALERQVEALHTRHELDVAADLGAEPNLPLETKEALYRIAQEALHNTVKHAKATRVGLGLHVTAREARLEVVDDGVGFDPAQSFPGHLGQTSMRERAEQLGGTLVVESAPGRGARITARIPLQRGAGPS